MQQLVLIESQRQLARTSTVAAVPAMDPDVVVRDSPDSHWVLIDDDAQIMGRCSLWWHNTPPYCEHRIGVIGHYAASDNWAGRRVLEHACEELAAHGCTMAVGPMDGNTWRQYRLVTDFGSEPTFFLEPTNPTEWPGHFVENGFEPLAEYFSALNDDLGCEDPLIGRIAEQMDTLEVRIRSLEPKHFEDDLRRIYSVAKVSFQDNLLYTSLGEEDFIDLYRPMQHVVHHDFVLIAERRNETVGFMFAVPDLLQADRGETIDTLIVKTLAVLPGNDYAGLGYLLLDHTRLTARRLGYARLIHALVRDAGYLHRRVNKFGRPIRRYILFAKELRS